MTETDLSTHRNSAGGLRAERIAQGLSLRELAHFAGCSHATIQRLEAGRLDVAPALRARIARALRVRVDELWPDPDPEMSAPAVAGDQGALEENRNAPYHPRAAA